MDNLYFINNSTDIYVQVKVEFMHSSNTLVLGEFCELEEFQASNENMTCYDPGLYSFILEDFELPAESAESAANWLRIGMTATLTIDFWEKNYKDYQMGCSMFELGTDLTKISQDENSLSLSDEQIFLFGGIALGVFFVTGVIVIHLSGRSRRRELAELQQARLMGDVVDWGVRVE